MLGEIREVGKLDSEVEIVRAGLEDVLATARALGGDDWLEVGIEQRRLQFVELFQKGRLGESATRRAGRGEAGVASVRRK